MDWGYRASVAVLAFLLLFAGCGGEDASADPGGAAGAAGPAIGKGHLVPTDIPVIEIPEPEPELPTGLLVMIDNQDGARPQAGLDKADLVYEIIAEGGITRYMALFYSKAAEVVGPVRSARYYFVQLAKGYDLPFAHVGGSDDAFSMIGNLRIKDLDEVINAQEYYWLDPARRRPHATYTSTARLVEAVQNKRYAMKAPELPPLGEEFSGELLGSGEIVVTYATGWYAYRVQWLWETELGDGEGKYRRFINGQAQATADGVPLTADTVFILAAKSGHRDTVPVTSDVAIVGGGEAMCIVDNQIIRGTWKKDTAEAPLRIYDSAGNLMTRKPGNTWIQVVNSMGDVSFGG